MKFKLNGKKNSCQILTFILNFKFNFFYITKQDIYKFMDFKFQISNLISEI